MEGRGGERGLPLPGLLKCAIYFECLHVTLSNSKEPLKVLSSSALRAASPSIFLNKSNRRVILIRRY